MLEYMLVWASGLATLATAVLGAWVTYHGEDAKNWRTLIFAAFVVLGLLGVGAQIKVGLEAIDANKRAEDAQARLNVAIEQLSAASTANQKLAGETLQQVIGDPDHPPYLLFTDFDTNVSPITARGYLVNSSRRYAARVVSITVSIDGRKYSSEAQDVSPSYGSLPSRGAVTFPNQGPGEGRTIHFEGLEAEKVVYFQVIINTAVGAYRQRSAIAMSKDGTISQGLKVFRSEDSKNHLVYEKEGGFPTNLERLLELLD